jgi:hypothetical protein
MKKLLSIIALLLLTALTACGGGGGGGAAGSAKAPAKLGISSSSKALFIGKESDQYARMSLPDRIHAAIFKSAYAAGNNKISYQVMADGSIEIVPILDADGNEIPVDIKQLREVTVKVVGIALTVSGTEYRVLGDKNTGVLYDLSKYPDISKFTEGNSTDEILTSYNGEIRKISLADGTHTALNNTNYITVQDYARTLKGYYYTIDLDASDYVAGYYDTTNGVLKTDYNYPLIISGGKILAGINSAQFVEIDRVNNTTKNVNRSVYGTWDTNISEVSSIIAPNGNIYNIIRDASGTEVDVRFKSPGALDVDIYTYDVQGTGPNKRFCYFLPIQHNYAPHDIDRYVITQQGYIHVTAENITDGKLVLTNANWKDKVMTPLYDLESSECPIVIKGSKVYGVNGNTICSADIEDSQISLTKEHTAVESIKKIWVINNVIYYLCFAPGSTTQLITYKVTGPDPDMRVNINISDVNTEALVELTI